MVYRKIHKAINNNDIEEILLLLDNGEPLNYNDVHETNPLDRAIFNNNENLVKLFIERGSNIHTLHEYALRKATDLNLFEIVKILVEHGADINTKCTCYIVEKSAWNVALENNNKQIINYFIETGNVSWTNINNSIYKEYYIHIKNIKRMIFLLDFHYKRELILHQDYLTDCNMLSIVFSY